MKLLFTLLALFFALHANAATYMLLSQTNGFAAGITNKAKSYTDSLTVVSANPTATIGLSAVNGSAATFMRSDAAPALTKASATNILGFSGSSADVMLGNGNFGVVAFANTTNSLAAPGDTTQYLNGQGLWSTPSGGTTNMMVSTITWGATLSPTFAITGLSTVSAAPRRVTFRATADANATTVNAPAGTLIDGDTMVWEILQDGTGGWTISGWDAKYAFGTDITGITLSTGANLRDFITFTYNSTADKWFVVGYVRGY